MKKKMIIFFALFLAFLTLPLLSGCKGEHKHTYSTYIEEVAATCENEGTLGHYECTECHKYFDANKVEITDISIPLAPHTYSDFHARVESTCTSEGSLGHYECEVCHKYFDQNLDAIESITIAKKEHDYGDLIPAVEPTCTSEGSIAHYQCGDCDKYFNANKDEVTSIAVDCEDHTYGDLVVAVEAGCFSEGSVAYYECSECHNKFDSSKNKITSVKVPAHGSHSYESGVCTRCNLPEGVKSVAEAMLVKDKSIKNTLRAVVIGHSSSYNGGYVYLVVKDLFSDQVCGIRKQVAGDGLDGYETSCVAGDTRNPSSPFEVGDIIEVPVSVNVGTATVGGGKGQILFIYRGEDLTGHPELAANYVVGKTTDINVSESSSVATITNQDELVSFLNGNNQWKLVCLKGTAANPIKMATFTKNDTEDISLEYINFFFHDDVSAKSDAKAAGAYPVLANFANVAQMDQALSTILFGQMEYEKTDYKDPNYFVGEIYCLIVGGSTSYFHFVVLQEDHIHNSVSFDGIAISPSVAKRTFFAEMEYKAAEIGIELKADITSAVGVSNVVGCNDLVRIGIAAMKTPAVANIWGKMEFATQYKDNTGTVKDLTITNRNVSDLTLEYLPLDQIVGIKGGSLSGTTTSRPYPIANTLVAVKGPDDSVIVVATVMNATDTAAKNRYKAAAQVVEIIKAKYNNQDTTSLEANLECYAAAGVLLPKENAPANGYDWWGNESSVVNFTYNGDAAITTASCWKAMTAITAISLYDETHFQEEFTVYKSELSSTINSSVPNFQGGEVVTYEVAMHSMLLSSSNVAPSAIARFVGEKIVKGEISSLNSAG